MSACIPIVQLLLQQMSPCIAEKHTNALLYMIVGERDRSMQTFKECRDTTPNDSAYRHETSKGDKNHEISVGAHLVHGMSTVDYVTKGKARSGNIRDPSSKVDISLSTRSNVATVGQHTAHVFALAVAGDLLYSASASTDIRVFKTPLFEQLDCFGSGNGMVNSLLTFGDRLYSAHQDNKIRVWKRVWNDDFTFKHKLLNVLPRLDHYVKCILLDRKYVQVRRHKKKLWIEHADTISALAMGGSCSTEGDVHDNVHSTPTVLYSASWDKTVKVWSLNNHKCIESFYAHNDAINAMTVIGGLVLATASADRTIKLWARVGNFSARKRKHSLLGTLHGHKAAVNALATSANAKILYSGGSDGAVVAWKRVYNKLQSRASMNYSSTASMSVSGGACNTADQISGEMDMVLGEAIVSLVKDDSSSEMMSSPLSKINFGSGSLAGLRKVSQHNRAMASSVSFVMRKVMVGHTRAVLSVSAVGDNIVCSSSADKTIRVWIRESAAASDGLRRRSRDAGGDENLVGRSSSWEYECLAVLAGHGGPVKSIASVLCLSAALAGQLRHRITSPNSKAHCAGDDESGDGLGAAAVEVDGGDHDGEADEAAIVVYSGGLDSKVKVWALPLNRSKENKVNTSHTES
ncbi:hypothetical protein L7F22_036058 [Adiantum nelumboides]|nr:hypothetical protein [Adiantum nelumboides]